MNLTKYQDPVLGIIDLTGFEPLINDPIFYGQESVRQLGTAYMTFPCSTQTRLPHGLGTGFRTLIHGRNLRLDEITLRSLVCYALLHDVGHYAFSHNLESFGRRNHEENTVLQIEKLIQQIILCGADFDLVLAIAQKQNPLYKTVLDKNVGMDKIDYLHRDSFIAGIKGLPDLAILQSAIGFDGTDVYLKYFGLQELMDFQRFYIKMYHQIYLHFPHLKLSSALRRCVHLMLKNNIITIGQLDGMKDFEIEAKISEHNTYREIFNRIRTRFIPVISVKNASSLQLITDETAHFFVQQDKIDALRNKCKKFEALLELERNIACLIGGDLNDVLCVPRLNHYRFVPKDIRIEKFNGSYINLSELMPMHFQAMYEQALHFSALKIFVSSEFLDRAKDKAREIIEFIFEIFI